MLSSTRGIYIRNYRQFIGSKLSSLYSVAIIIPRRSAINDDSNRETEWVRPTNVDEVSVLGKQFNEILFKGRQGNPVGLADLRKLLAKCDSPAHVKYAVKSVQYFQDKGNDFEIDVNSLFVKACCRGNDPMAAAKIFLQVK